MDLFLLILVVIANLIILFGIGSILWVIKDWLTKKIKAFRDGETS
jgi:hypothetical protein